MLGFLALGLPRFHSSSTITMEIGNAMATGFFKAACGKSWPLSSNLVAPDVAELQRVLDFDWDDSANFAFRPALI